jgi:hypothetical protein
MTFWEFSVACEGFESFHAAPDDEANEPPSPEQFWAAIGVEP